MTTSVKRHSVWPAAGLALILALQFGPDRGLCRSHRAELQLPTVAERKAGQIAEWRAVRLTHAGLLMDRPALRRALSGSITVTEPPLADEVLARLRALQDYRDDRNAMVVGASGRLLFSIRAYRAFMYRESAEALRIAERERGAVLTDPHDGPRGFPPSVRTGVPILSSGRRPTLSCGALILQSDPARQLYPMPQPRRSATPSTETALIRPHGGDWLAMKELRQFPGAALRLRRPSGQRPHWVQTNGLGSVSFGRAHRSIEFFPVIRAVPHSPWHIVAQTDAADDKKPMLALHAALRIATAALAAPIRQQSAVSCRPRQDTLRASARSGDEGRATIWMNQDDALMASNADADNGRVNPVAGICRAESSPPGTSTL